VGHVFDVSGEGELVVLGEIAGQGDDDQCGAPVGCPQGVGPGGPGIGDVEDAVEVAASLAGVPAKGAPVRLRRPFFSRLVDRFATRVAMSIADEVELRAWDRFRL